MATTVLKTVLKSDIRRFPLAAATDFGELQARVAALYAINPRPIFTYNDEDGDTITVACQQDLDAALAVAGPTARFTVIPTRKGGPPPPPGPPPSRTPRRTQAAPQAPRSSVRRTPPRPSPRQALLRDIRATAKARRETTSDSRARQRLLAAICTARTSGRWPLRKVKRRVGRLEESAKYRDVVRRMGAFVARQKAAFRSAIRAENIRARWGPEDRERIVAACRRVVAIRTGQVVHEGVRCDGCGCDIVGLRHKCAQLPDFDLCTQCLTSGVHGCYTFLSFRVPNTHERRLCWTPSGAVPRSPTTPTAAPRPANPSTTAAAQVSERARLIALRNRAAEMARLAAKARDQARAADAAAGEAVAFRDALAHKLAERRRRASSTN